jgi:hypothetical protein
MRRPTWFLAVAACAGLAAVPACRKETKKEEPPAATSPAASPADPAAGQPADPPVGQLGDPASGQPSAALEMPRPIEIRVDDKGYHPPSAPAKAGEQLLLAFTRTSESECVRQVIVDGKTTELPLNQRVEIPVTMPATGDLVFTCGMKMYEGRVAVAK